MRRSAMVASHPWTILITLEEDPDSLGCWARFQELNLDGATADSWERFYSRLEEALRDLEMCYGVEPGDWVDSI